MQGKNNSLEEIQSTYEKPESVATLSTWYRREKEEAFFDHVFRDLNPPLQGQFVEIGGGAGLQGLILKEKLGERYLHTDYSKSMVAKARELGLNSQVVDGLSMPFPDRSVAGLLLVGPTTIIRDDPMRQRQFAECARVLAPKAPVVFVTGRMAKAGQHCLDASDRARLKEFGLTVERSENWGLVPGRFWAKWNAPLLAGLERILVAANLGVRNIVVARQLAEI